MVFLQRLRHQTLDIVAFSRMDPASSSCQICRAQVLSNGFETCPDKRFRTPPGHRWQAFVGYQLQSHSRSIRSIDFLP